MDLHPDQFGDFCLHIMKNREEVLKNILRDIQQVEKQQAGLMSVIPSLTEETSDANLRHQLKTCMQVQAQQAQIIRTLLMISLINISSQDFVAQVAQLANKFGKGEEALREMFNQKLRGG